MKPEYSEEEMRRHELEQLNMSSNDVVDHLQDTNNILFDIRKELANVVILLTKQIIILEKSYKDMPED